MYIFSRKETFSDPELNDFQEKVIDWAKKFMKLFSPIADTEMKFLKFHIWCYYMINTIREYGAINAKKHRQTSTLSGIKESFLLSDFNEFINEYKATHHLAQEDEKAFDILIEALNQYFDFIEGINDDDVKATLIKCNVAINMNEEEAENYHTVDGTCFAKLLMLFSLKIPGHEEKNLALVNWYDFKYNVSHRLFKYDCPHLKKILIFTVIAVESIIEPIHIVPRFEKDNEYFVNLFIF
ncbi:hypothetical protein RhiirB3_387349 [Rhizophagus irregularis]|nr:hypothetical protein RhiirB3_387349 [Rhizophagus irregularis]